MLYLKATSGDILPAVDEKFHYDARFVRKSSNVHALRILTLACKYKNMADIETPEKYKIHVNCCHFETKIVLYIVSPLGQYHFPLGLINHNIAQKGVFYL